MGVSLPMPKSSNFNLLSSNLMGHTVCLGLLAKKQMVTGVKFKRDLQKPASAEYMGEEDAGFKAVHLTQVGVLLSQDERSSFGGCLLPTHPLTPYSPLAASPHLGHGRQGNASQWLGELAFQSSESILQYPTCPEEQSSVRQPLSASLKGEAVSEPTAFYEQTKV